MLSKTFIKKITSPISLIFMSLLINVNGKASAQEVNHNFKYNSKEINQICNASQNISRPSKEQPYNGTVKKSLNQCDAISLYYGFENAPDYSKARECALSNNDYAVLTMIYANGKNVEPNLDLALHYACILEAAPAETESRVKHLYKLKMMKNSKEDFNICDDITSGQMMGWCANLARRSQKVQQTRKLDAMKLKWSDAEKEAFQKLQDTSSVYFKLHAENEIDNGGSGRAAFCILEEMALNDRMMENIQKISQCKLPYYTLEQYKQNDRHLNIIYKKILNSSFTDLSTLTKDGIIKTEKAWIKYRDAMINFGHLKCPLISAQSLNTMITKQRMKELKGINE